MSISTLEDFHILSTLGQGSYGLVYKVERLVLNKTNIDNKNSKKQKKKKKKSICYETNTIATNDKRRTI